MRRHKVSSKKFQEEVRAEAFHHPNNADVLSPEQEKHNSILSVPKTLYFSISQGTHNLRFDYLLVDMCH